MGTCVTLPDVCAALTSFELPVTKSLPANTFASTAPAGGFVTDHEMVSVSPLKDGLGLTEHVIDGAGTDTLRLLVATTALEAVSRSSHVIDVSATSGWVVTVPLVPEPARTCPPALMLTSKPAGGFVTV